jgi:L-alanine-DL-glutamate epimerase-like enolase superfamily enzyme
VSDWHRLRDLPLEIDDYALERLEQDVSSAFTRVSTVIRLRGGGEEGIGEDVVYDAEDHDAAQQAGPTLPLAGRHTLGSFSELLATLDLFPQPPLREVSPLYRRYAYESAALDLALRQAGVPFHEAVGREPKPLRFVCSTRLTTFGDDADGSSTKAISDRLAKYPGLEFKLDPENDWTDELIEEIRELASVQVLDLKGLYRGTPVDVETDPVLYKAVAETFPEAYLEDPDINDETREVLAPYDERVTWDANLHSLDDVKGNARKAINSKPSRFGSLAELLSIYEYCEANGIAVYGGGQGELAVGRGQIQYLASVFHPDTPNDTAPSGFNDPAVPEGMPSSPMEPVPSVVGFRWAE